MTPDEVAAFKSELTSIKTVLVGIPDTASRGLVGEVIGMKDEMMRRFDKVYASLDSTGTRFLSKEDCENCDAKKALQSPKGSSTPYGINMEGWRFWLLLGVILGGLVGADALRGLLKTFGL